LGFQFSRSSKLSIPSLPLSPSQRPDREKVADDNPELLEFQQRMRDALTLTQPQPNPIQEQIDALKDDLEALKAK
jgi:hypothetical protein